MDDGCTSREWAGRAAQLLDKRVQGEIDRIGLFRQVEGNPQLFGE
jgi:hypothetical protein